MSSPRWFVFATACLTKTATGVTACARWKGRMILPAWQKSCGGGIRVCCLKHGEQTLTRQNSHRRMRQTPLDGLKVAHASRLREGRTRKPEARATLDYLISSSSMEEKANSQPLVVNCSDWDCTICRLSGWRKNTRKFIGPAARCRCDFQWILLPCDCFSASAMRRIGLPTRITSC